MADYTTLHNRIRIAVELHKGVDIIPNFFVVGMKNVSSVIMDIDTFGIETESISADMVTAVDDQALFPAFGGFMRPYISEQPRTYY
jgi:hypothetical protein